MSLPSVLFVFFALTLVVIALGLASFRRRPRPPAPPVAPPARPALLDPPPAEREIGLKVCPECRELVLLASGTCKYCGSTQSTAPFAPRAEPVLKIPAPPRRTNTPRFPAA